MKVVILAGGFGTRISEETLLRPKPMVEIGNRPILWHIMKAYSYYGFNEFIICCGYKGYIIKEYFANYFLHTSDITFDILNNTMEVHQKNAEPWSVTLVDTGEESMTGGRLKQVAKFLKGEEAFCFTYGDGLSDIDFKSQMNFHKRHGKLATITAVKPPGRYGALSINANNGVTGFTEKPRGDGGMINGGFFILSPACINLIDAYDVIWESEPLSALVSNNELMAFQHNGFWHAMDTLRDKNYLEDLWSAGSAPWKVW
jgi:glucose-1-phosphate cytidylyltransferase